MILAVPSIDPLADYERARDRIKELQEYAAGARARGHHDRAERYEAEISLVWQPRFTEATEQIRSTTRELRDQYHRARRTPRSRPHAA